MVEWLGLVVCQVIEAVATRNVTHKGALTGTWSPLRLVGALKVIAVVRIAIFKRSFKY